MTGVFRLGAITNTYYFPPTIYSHLEGATEESFRPSRSLTSYAESSRLTHYPVKIPAYGP